MRAVNIDFLRPKLLVILAFLDRFLLLYIET
jgi:hypothetical protein